MATMTSTQTLCAQRLGSVRRVGGARVASVNRAASVAPARAPLSVVAEAAVGAKSAASSKINSQDFSYSLPGVDETVLSIILGGGAGTRLYPLTKSRSKPAVPLAGNYRLIDIPVSNCINSNMNKIYCLTQFNSASLNRHLSNAYNSNIGTYNKRGFVEVLAATQSPSNKKWFQGTADAVRQYLWLFEDAMRQGTEEFLILSGDHLYRCNYQDFVAKHREAGADITIAALPCDEKKASAFGVMKIDDTGKITDFAEKPQGDALKAMQVDTSILGVDPAVAKENPFIASMGIYVIKASAMVDLLKNKFPDAVDFGSEVLPGAKDMGMHLQAYAYEGYWEDIGTIEAFYNANLSLVDPNGANFSFYDRDAPIYTMSRFLPPCKVLDADVTNAIIGDGCIVGPGSKVSNSVVGLRTIIGSNVTIEDALVMGADYYERPDECQLVPGCLPMGLGDNCVVRKCIIDKNARIGEGVQIINADNVMEANHEDEGYIIKDGITVICKDAIIPDGTII